MKSQHPCKDAFIIGFALFSMFFGAGNVIFPPYLGMGTGSQWGLGFLCYYIADIGLALLALFSMFRRGGSAPIIRPIGKVASTLLMCAIVLCIGPMLAIPRTAATTFEMSIAPLVEGVSSVLFSVIFFSLILLFSIRQSAVVDLVGKVLTPLLLIGLLILIIKGMLSPLGPVDAPPQVSEVAATGIKAGYQTMDVLATMLFGVLILNTVASKGYTDPKEKRKVATGAGLLSGALLLVIYGGLTYLGATVSSFYDLSISRSELILAIVSNLLGQKGTVLFAIVVALACVTTAVGLVSSCSSYFAQLFQGRISYSALVVIICVFSAVVSNVGLDQLVSIAAPVLDIVYPPALVLILLSYLKPLPAPVYHWATGGALLVSLLGAISAYTPLHLAFLDHLPLASLGFGWVIPTAVFALLGLGLARLMGSPIVETDGEVLS